MNADDDSVAEEAVVLVAEVALVGLLLKFRGTCC